MLVCRRQSLINQPLKNNNHQPITTTLHSVLGVQVPPDAHRSVLVDLLTVHGVRQGGGLGKSIVFTRTKREADEVAAAIAQSLACEPLHGDISQAVR